MKYNPWTLALVSAGLVSLPAVTQGGRKAEFGLTALSSTTLSGYVDTSAQWNPGTGNANLPPYAFGGPTKADGFNLNVAKLTLANDIVPEDAWGAGYKADLIFGPDANSFSTQSSLATGKSDFGVKQAYVALRAPVANGLNFKLGVWDTIIGYEVFESGNNPNFTRSYGWTLEPVTHTGLLASYQFSELVTASAGVANTHGPQINERGLPSLGPKAESYKTYMGSLTLTAPEAMGFLAGSTLSGCVVNGFNSALGNETSYYRAPPSTHRSPASGWALPSTFWTSLE